MILAVLELARDEAASLARSKLNHNCGPGRQYPYGPGADVLRHACFRRAAAMGLSAVCSRLVYLPDPRRNW